MDCHFFISKRYELKVILNSILRPKLEFNNRIKIEENVTKEKM